MNLPAIPPVTTTRGAYDFMLAFIFFVLIAVSLLFVAFGLVHL